MKGLLFTGGEGPSPDSSILELIKGFNISAAADSGFYLAQKFHISPDFILGDMDSLENPEKILELYPPDKILRYQAEKDYTDTELGISFLKEKGCSEIIVIGGSGGRTDHLIGIFTLFYRNLHPDIWILKDETAFSVKGKFSLKTTPGEVISLFPVTKDSCRMVSSGLKWGLDNLEWEPGDNGISNVALGEFIEIEMIKGKLLLFRENKRQGH